MLGSWVRLHSSASGGTNRVWGLPTRIVSPTSSSLCRVGWHSLPAASCDMVHTPCPAGYARARAATTGCDCSGRTSSTTSGIAASVWGNHRAARTSAVVYCQLDDDMPSCSRRSGILAGDSGSMAAFMRRCACSSVGAGPLSNRQGVRLSRSGFAETFPTVRAGREWNRRRQSQAGRTVP